MWHHLLQASKECVSQCELIDGGLQVFHHDAFVASSETSLSRQLLKHIVQNISLAFCEATNLLRYSWLLQLFVGLVFFHFNYN